MKLLDTQEQELFAMAEERGFGEGNSRSSGDRTSSSSTTDRKISIGVRSDTLITTTTTFLFVRRPKRPLSPSNKWGNGLRESQVFAVSSLAG